MSWIKNHVLKPQNLLLIALLAALCLIVLPIGVRAMQPQVTVIVENTTFTESFAEYDSLSGETKIYTPAWSGQKIKETVEVADGDTAIELVARALEQAGITDVSGIDSNYITGIDGLDAYDGGYMSGWMCSLNDWFLAEGLNAYSYDDGEINDGDVIKVLYTTDWGADLGSDWSNNDKTLADLEFSEGSLSPDFDADTHTYTLTVPDGVDEITAIPTASNKNFQVRSGVGLLEYANNRCIPIENGTVVSVVCGNPSWPTMNYADDVAAEVYTVTVAVEGAAANHAPTFQEGITSPVSVSLYSGEDCSLDLSSIFSDEDNDALSYAVSVDNGAKQEVDAEYSTKISNCVLNFYAFDGKTYSQPYTVNLSVKSVTATTPTVSGGNMGNIFYRLVADSTVLPESYCNIKSGSYNGTLSYQWYLRNVTANAAAEYEAIPEATTVKYTLPISMINTEAGIYQYFCRITNTVGGDAKNSASVDSGANTVVVTASDSYLLRVSNAHTLKLYKTVEQDGVKSEVAVDIGEPLAVSSYLEYSPALTVGTTYRYEGFDADGNSLAGGSFTVKENVYKYYFGQVKFTVGSQDIANYTIQLKDADGNQITPVQITDGTLTKYSSMLQGYQLDNDNVGSNIKYTYKATAKQGLWNSGYAFSSNDWTSINGVSWGVTNISASLLPIINITVPSDSQLILGAKTGKHYMPFTTYDSIMESTNKLTGNTTYSYALTLNSQYNIRVTMDGKITYADRFVATVGLELNIAADDLFDTDSSYEDTYQNDIYLNVPASHQLLLDTGETFQIIPFRIYQIVDNITNNYFFEPDYHYSIISGDDVVSIDQDGLLTANQAGTALVLVSYDALETWLTGSAGDQLSTVQHIYDAVDPYRIGVFAVTVGQDGSVSTGIDYDADFETVYYAATVNGNEVADAHAVYTFTPATDSTVEIMRLKVTDGNVDTATGFVTDGVTKNVDGSYTVNLSDGRNILKISKDGLVAYQVLTAAGVDVAYSNVTTGGDTYAPGNKVLITVTGALAPVQKMSGIYNPQSGIVVYNDEDGNELKNSSKSFSFTIPSSWTGATYTIDNGHIYTWWYGSEAGAHRDVSLETGVGVNTSAGSPFGDFCVLPDIVIPIQQPDTRYTVTFVAPEGVSIDVADSNGAEMTATDSDDNIFALPSGNYTYTVSGSGYQTESHQFSFYNTEDVTIAVPLTLAATSGSAWDGTTSEPTLKNGVYQISNGAQLAWFAAQVNSGNNSINAKITQDIALSTEYSWTPIGTSSKKFLGVFDGNGHTVYNMTIDAFQYKGLFGYIGSGATVSDLTVTGTLTNTTATYNQSLFHGGIAGANAGTITGCVNRVAITGYVNGMLGQGSIAAYAGGIIGANLGGTVSDCVNYSNVNIVGRYLGGIAGNNTGTITDCLNYGDISGNLYISGIVGQSSNLVENCANYGDINASSSYAAGIVTVLSGGTITGCINTGDISATSYSGGIAANASSANVSVINCYNNGKILATTTTYAGGVVGNLSGSGAAVTNCYNTGSSAGNAVIGYAKTTASAANCYYLQGSATADALDGSGVTVKTTVELKCLAATLGDGFVTDDLQINSGYPVLAWQPHGSISAPVITGQPLDAVYQTNTTADYLLVSADGSNLSYQWYKKAMGDSDFTAIQYEVSNFYQPAITDVGTIQYKVKVTSTVGNSSDSVWSNAASIVVLDSADEVSSCRVDLTITKINAIGTVTLDSKDAIESARAFYDALSADEQTQVTNYSTLSAAEDSLTLLQAKDSAKTTLAAYKSAADYRQAQQTELSDAIAAGNTAIDNSTTTDAVNTALSDAKAAIDAIKTAAQLSSEESATTLSQTKADAKTELAAYKDATDYREAQQTELSAAITSGNTAIDNATTADAVATALTNAKTAIDAIKTATQLTEEENTAAEQLAIQGVIDKIDAIGRVSLSSRTAIETARSAYDELTETGQAAVTNYSTLTAAEKALAALITVNREQYLNALSNVQSYIESNVSDPSLGSSGGEWAVLSLARGEVAADSWYDIYLTNIRSAIADADGVLDSTGNKYTEYSRVILALTSLGENASAFEAGEDTYDLVDSLLGTYSNGNYIALNQGVNGAAFALLAIDSAPYVTEDTVARVAFIGYLLEHQTGDGWSLSEAGTKLDLDMTAMVIQSLAPYYLDADKYNALGYSMSYSDFQQVVDTALTALSAETPTSAESSAQLVVMLSALDLDAMNDARFGYTLSGLLVYCDSDTGAFRHTLSSSINQMSTEQAAYALVAYDRYANAENPLYAMSDVFEAKNAASLTAAKAAVSGISYTVSMKLANTQEDLCSWMEDKIKSLGLNGVTATVEINDFTAAVAGTAGDTDGTAGSFNATVMLTADNELQQQSDTVTASGTVTATTYSGSSGGDTDNITVTFRLIGATLSDEDINLGTGDYEGSEYQTWIKTKSYTIDEGSTMYDLFTEALDDAGLDSIGASSNYIKTIYAPSVLGGYALSESSNGKYSGWMYTVNGSHPNVGLRYCELCDGDEVIWHYVDDYRYEVEDWVESTLGDESTWNKWLEVADVKPTSGSTSGDSSDSSGDSSVNSNDTCLTPKVTAANGVATATISQSDMTSAIKDAKENSSAAIVIAPYITGEATKVSVDILKSSLSSIVTQTSADLTVQTSVGTVTIPNSALSSIASQAAGSTVTVSLEMVEKTTLSVDQQSVVGSNPVYDISVLSGSTHISSFGGSSLTVSLPYTLKDGEDPNGVTVWYLNDAGELQQMTCKYDETTGLATFTTTHLSYYVVGYSTVWTNPFNDVKLSDWYYDAVKYIFENNLMTGTSGAAFTPNGNMTRAMLVTVLYRQAGQPSISGTSTFTDVNSGQWYTDAVIWASSNGIVSGYGDSLFGTNDSITREQLAVILYNYAKYKGYDVTATAALTAFNDTASISSWARAAMAWANAEGLINGISNTSLSPKGNATRAQVATILMRFIQNI